jgi:hypothetical protein
MIKKILRIISLLVDPPASIRAPHLRRQAQFMSALILIVVPTGLMAELFYIGSTHDWQSLNISLFGASLFLIIYVLNRTGWVILASNLNIIVSTALILWIAANDPANNYNMLFYLLYPIIAGVYFFGFPQLC